MHNNSRRRLALWKNSLLERIGRSEKKKKSKLSFWGMRRRREEGEKEWKRINSIHDLLREKRLKKVSQSIFLSPPRSMMKENFSKIFLSRNKKLFDECDDVDLVREKLWTSERSAHLAKTVKHWVKNDPFEHAEASACTWNLNNYSEKAALFTYLLAA